MLLALMMAMALSEPDPRGPVILDPAPFIEQPDRNDRERALDRYLSTRAYSYRGALHVVMACAVKKVGYLDASEIVEESPAGVGLGEMALKLSTKFRLPKEINGVSVEGGRVKIPMTIVPPSD